MQFKQEITSRDRCLFHSHKPCPVQHLLLYQDTCLKHYSCTAPLIPPSLIMDEPCPPALFSHIFHVQTHCGCFFKFKINSVTFFRLRVAAMQFTFPLMCPVPYVLSLLLKLLECHSQTSAMHKAFL